MMFPVVVVVDDDDDDKGHEWFKPSSCRMSALAPTPTRTGSQAPDAAPALAPALDLRDPGALPLC